MDAMDIGLALSVYQKKMVNNVVKDFNLKFEDMTYSSGRSLIFKKNDTVYQLYLAEALFNIVCHNIKLSANVNGIVKMINIYPKYNTIQYEYVEPIYDIHTKTIKADLKRLYHDVKTILKNLDINQLVHGDFCCDNMGYSQVQNKYVLYDLETLHRMRCDEQDVDSYNIAKSFKFVTH